MATVDCYRQHHEEFRGRDSRVGSRSFEDVLVYV